MFYHWLLSYDSPGCGAFYDAAVANQVRSSQNTLLRRTNDDDLRDRYARLHREKMTKNSTRSDDKVGQSHDITYFTFM